MRNYTQQMSYLRFAIAKPSRPTVTDARVQPRRGHTHPAPVGRRQKEVYVTVSCGLDGEVSIRVRDEGHGFDPRVLLDPTDRNHLLLSHGRGIYLIRTVMDEVSFEEGGRVVFMRKKVARPPYPAFGTQSLPKQTLIGNLHD
jgi:hypothetical protein